MTETAPIRPVQSNVRPVEGAVTPPGYLEHEPARTTGSPLRVTRTSAAWVGVIVFAIVLTLLLIFIVQNTQPVEISYFGASGRVSLAVAMLLAAVAGVLLTAVAGSLRIWQLRRRLRRTNRPESDFAR